MSEPMTDEEIRATVERERKAHVEMQRIVGVGDWWGRRESPQISIPADMERDSDLVIARSLSDVPALAAECLRRGEEIARLVADRDEARESAKKYLAEWGATRWELGQARDDISRLVWGIRGILARDEGRINTHYEGCESAHWRCWLTKLLKEVER